MGQEVRRVPANWEHPKDHRGQYIPLLDGLSSEVRDWDDQKAKWDRGEFPTFADNESRKMGYAEWAGKRPEAKDYMPEFADGEDTHYMMYETCSDGTPISPSFATPEALAQWLADTGASAFGSQRGSYEGWLRVARGNSAPSAVYIPGLGLINGVDAPLEDEHPPGGGDR